MKPISYQECYEILSLPSDIKWEQASMHYRKLVQRWHPDRYDGDDTELAQRRFIELTTAFNKLRDYHQSHKCLPFSGEGINASNDDSYTQTASSGSFTSEATLNPSVSHHDIRNSKDSATAKKSFRIPTPLKYFGIMLLAGFLVLSIFAKMDESDLQAYKYDERVNFASETYGQSRADVEQNIAAPAAVNPAAVNKE